MRQNIPESDKPGLINHMKKALLKLFNSDKECFIKFGKINDHILNKLLQTCKL